MKGLKNNTSAQEAVRKRRGDYMTDPSLKSSSAHFEFIFIDIIPIIYKNDKQMIEYTRQQSPP